MEKQTYREIDQHLTFYKTAHGFSIRQRPSYATMGIMSLGMIFIFVCGALSVALKEYTMTGIMLLLFIGLLSYFLSRSEMIFDKQHKTYTYQFFVFRFLLFSRQGQFTLPQFRIYDSEIDEPGLRSSEDGAIYKLQVMKGQRFENVFTFNSIESAYGFKKAIVKWDKDFYFETKN